MSFDEDNEEYSLMEC